jgi:2-amino-4-hydroxy-6-hydroxymethyldihydropteridine diphosphokinase
MANVFLALGSNLGDRTAHLEQAVDALTSLGSVEAGSPIYETAPVGGPDQGPYLNAVIKLDTDLPAMHLLERLLEIEKGAGRARTVRWGPRTLDLDILLYGDETID